MTLGTRARPSTKPVRGVVLVSLSGIVWGTVGPTVHLAVEHTGLSALTVTAYRALASVILLDLVLLLTGRFGSAVAAARLHGRRLGLVGVMTALSQLLYFSSVGMAGVSLSTVICMGFAPPLLLMVTCVRGRRLPSRWESLTVCMAVLGLLLISLVGGGRENASNPPLGILAALGAGAAFALSADAVAPLTTQVHPLSITASTMSVAALVLVPCGLFFARRDAAPLTTPHAAAWLFILYLALALVATWALLFAGLRTTSAGTAVVATLLEPVTAVFIATLFLGERLAVGGLVGSALIVAAIATCGRIETASPRPDVDLATHPR